ncbi:uncharacterized protein N7496_002367 [Penicillium cataractarum]|uniref:Secreted protein n=1 Tax=Penicillium cataractarum TaxID=2100454 RepID=A0A9W9SME9_9EURO|nr:uncharacterized protein N7496_002367 [Penicillium cataractarum]KAJ5379939.1 hypothetical protein N7496_002367 [Penicillium cataractarum]
MKPSRTLIVVLMSLTCVSEPPCGALGRMAQPLDVGHADEEESRITRLAASRRAPFKAVFAHS